MPAPSEQHIASRDPARTRFALTVVNETPPVAVSPLVAFHADRCISCGQCEAFAKDVLGTKLIRVRPGKELKPTALVAPGDDKAPYFSGNVAQVCPTNALAAIPHANRARPWDHDLVPTTCSSCAVGCRMALQTTDQRLTAAVGLDDPSRNRSWLCDRGRFGIEAQYSPARLQEPLLVRQARNAADALTPVAWDEALDAAANALRGVDASRLGFIGGATFTDQDQYAWVKLVKGLLATDNFDAQLGDGLPADVVLGSPRATIDEACSADVVVLVAPDLQEAAPVLYLRLREAVTQRGVQVIELSPGTTSFTPLAKHHLAYRAGDAAVVTDALLGRRSLGRDAAVASLDALANAQLTLATAEDVVVIAGRQSQAESSTAVAEAVGLLVQHARARLLPVLREANTVGALENGLAPNVLPGRIPLRAGRQWFTSGWGQVASKPGLDTLGMLRAAARAELDVLVLLGADPLRDVADRHLVHDAIETVGTLIVLDSLATETVVQADIAFPIPAFGEQHGSIINLEGERGPVAQAVVPVHNVRPPWLIATQIAALLDADLGCSAEDVIDEERQLLAPATRGASVEGAPLPLIYSVTEPSAPPAVDAYAVRLVTSPRLYDRSARTQRAEHLAPLAKAERVRMHSSTLAPLGIKATGKVRLLNGRGSLIVPVEVDDAVVRGTAVAPLNVPGLDITALIDASQSVTNVRVETP